jgi:hypothetical protein
MHAATFSWTDPTRLAEELTRAVAAFAAAVHDYRGAFGCFGVPTKVSCAARQLEPKWSAWNRLLELLVLTLPGRATT